MKEKLINGLSEIGIGISPETAGKMERYYEMLLEKNKVMNLTSITGEDEAVSKHFIDSLSVAAYTDCGRKAFREENKAVSVIDVGTGAGFPGLVLKIAFPHADLTLFDSLQKRLGFLEEVIEDLGIRDGKVRTLHGRAEDLGHDKEHRSRYDIVLARAVANMSTLSEYCLPLVKTGGVFIAYKTESAEEEASAAEKAIRLLGGKVESVNRFTLPGTDYERAFVIVRKVKETPGKYPRKAGTPSKEPL